MQELFEAVIPFLSSIGEALGGRQGVPPQVSDALPLVSQEARPHFPAPEIVGQERGEPSFIIRYESMEASMLNRIRKLERQNSLFLLSKAKGEYWSDVRAALNNCASQKDYYRLLYFENRDLQIRERKHECFSLFQEILSRNPVLRGDAAYNPTEDFLDFFSEKRDALDKNPEWGPVEKDRKEIEFIEQVKLDLAARGRESPYIQEILGSG